MFARRLHLLLWCTLVVAVCSFSARASEGWDWGIFSSKYTDIHGEEHVRFLGPLFETVDAKKDLSYLGIRPFYSTFEEKSLARKHHEFLWPVATAKSFKQERHARVLASWYLNYDVDDPESRWRFWSLPFYFQGRDSVGEDYLAVFPFGGHLNEFLGRDEIRFWAWPFYAWSVINFVETQDYLYPVYSKTDGKGIYRFRVFPFYGQSRHRDRFNKKFVLWPFWTSAEYFQEEYAGTGWILFPLVGHIDAVDRESWMIFPPFFRFTQQGNNSEIYAPWPFVQISSGEKEKFYLWPLFGKKKMATVESSFFLWPIFSTEKIERHGKVQRKFKALPLIIADKTTSLDDPNQVTSSYFKLWPLFSHRTDGDTKRFRFFDLWITKDLGQIDRNYAPFWTIFQRSSRGDSFDEEFAWGLYQHRKRGDESRHFSLFPFIETDRVQDERSWSVLKGLVGMDRSGTNSTFRLLYFLKFGQKDEQP